MPLFFKGRNTGPRVIWEARGLAAMYSLALFTCIVALSHWALAAKGKRLPLSKGNTILKCE